MSSRFQFWISRRRIQKKSPGIQNELSSLNLAWFSLLSIHTEMTAVHQEAQWSTPLDRLSISFLQWTNFHKVSDLEERNVLSLTVLESTVLEVRSPKSVSLGWNELLAGSGSLQTPGKNLFLTSSSQWMPALLCLWLYHSHLQTFLLCLHPCLWFIFTLPSAVCVSDLPLLLSYRNTCDLQLTQIIQDNFLISESLTTSAAKRSFSYQAYWKTCCCFSAAVFWADVPLAFWTMLTYMAKTLPRKPAFTVPRVSVVKICWDLLHLATGYTWDHHSRSLAKPAC